MSFFNFGKNEYVEDEMDMTEEVESMTDQISLLTIKDFDKSMMQNIKNALKETKVVIIKFEDGLQQVSQQRCLDYLAGAVKMIDYKIIPISDTIFLVCEGNTKVKIV